MKRWVTPSQWQRLQGTFGHFDAADSLRALDATCSLFSDVSREVAERLGFRYPVEVERSILEYVRALT
jgi:aminoglycoside 6-adenylyltransferase